MARNNSQVPALKLSRHTKSVIRRSVVVLAGMIAWGVALRYFYVRAIKANTSDPTEDCMATLQDAARCSSPVDMTQVWMETSLYMIMVTAGGLLILAVTGALVTYITPPGCRSNSCPCINHRRSVRYDNTGAVVAIGAAVASVFIANSGN